MPDPTRRPGRGPVRLTRRTLLWDLGAAVGMLALAACTDGAGDDSPSSSTPGSSAPTGPTLGAASTTPTSGPDDLRWERVIGGVSAAYVLVRGGEATIVDTGQPGTEVAIRDGLERLGLDWDAVSSILVTHRHGDHVGSLREVAERAPGAQLLAGEGDIEAFPSPREVQAVATGRTVMDLQVLETPGHTPGHVSVFDPASGVLLAGDAINGTEDGGVAGPNPSFTTDMETAWQSAAALADLAPDVILFGHGPPATDGAAAALDAVVA